MVDRTGLIIANVSKFSYLPIEVKEVGASASATFCASEKQGENLELGDLEIFTAEFSGGKIFTVSCSPKGVLSLITGPDINIAFIRLILKRAREELKKILDDFLDDFLNDDDKDRGPRKDPHSASAATLVDF